MNVATYLTRSDVYRHPKTAEFKTHKVCTHCNEIEDNHVGDVQKCPFEHTTFEWLSVLPVPAGKLFGE